MLPLLLLEGATGDIQPIGLLEKQVLPRTELAVS